MIVLSGWTEFWSKVGEFFVGIGENLYKFRIAPEDGSTGYIARLGFALIILILGYFLIRLLMRILYKLAKVDRSKLKKEVTFKSFMLDTLKVFLNV